MKPAAAAHHAAQNARPLAPPEIALAAARNNPEPAAMKFAIRNLSVLAYAQGFTLWHYKAGAGHLADCRAHGFFLPAADMLAVGDMVMVSAADGGAVLVVTAAGEDVTLGALS